ncbi:hypothetical protein [Roseibium sediminicola]|uniref:Uncharacterized protein n=1 Tax=Roseibium sediminicola TaxID=2933272 RepID=A0ABT0GQJ1_9HYPH|nr:hypothetical protein [Roseibium sp. CAU 1639]MCK7611693.1 hypothetical protein [Roseibium sp. CAU 1639]
MALEMAGYPKEYQLRSAGQYPLSGFLETATALTSLEPQALHLRVSLKAEIF